MSTAAALFSMASPPSPSATPRSLVFSPDQDSRQGPLKQQSDRKEGRSIFHATVVVNPIATTGAQLLLTSASPQKKDKALERYIYSYQGRMKSSKDIVDRAVTMSVITGDSDFRWSYKKLIGGITLSYADDLNERYQIINNLEFVPQTETALQKLKRCVGSNALAFLNDLSLVNLLTCVQKLLTEKLNIVHRGQIDFHVAIVVIRIALKYCEELLNDTSKAVKPYKYSGCSLEFDDQGQFAFESCQQSDALLETQRNYALKQISKVAQPVLGVTATGLPIDPAQSIKDVQDHYNGLKARIIDRYTNDTEQLNVIYRELEAADDLLVKEINQIIEPIPEEVEEDDSDNAAFTTPVGSDDEDNSRLMQATPPMQVTPPFQRTRQRIPETPCGKYS